MIDHDTTVLVLNVDSGTWRRRLGPLAWAALEHIALAATQDHQGWAARIGVRDIAAGIGVTKDTAARAVSLLRAAGLVTFEQLDPVGGRRRSGYRLHLPDGMRLRPCPPAYDSPSPPEQPERCPDPGDTPRQPAERKWTAGPDAVDSGGLPAKRSPPHPGPGDIAGAHPAARIVRPARPADHENP